MFTSFTCLLALWGSVAAVACVAAAVFRRRTLDLSRMPGPRGRWGSGNLADILQPHFHRVMSRWAAKYGEVYRVQVLGLNGVVVACPDTIQRLFGRGDDDIPKHVGSYWHLDILWSEGRTHSIFTDLATDSWRAVRRAVAPCFSTAAVRCAAAQRHCTVLSDRSQSRQGGPLSRNAPGAVGAVLCRQAFPLVKQKADDLTASLKKLGPTAAVDMDDAGMRFTLDVVALVHPSGMLA